MRQRPVDHFDVGRLVPAGAPLSPPPTSSAPILTAGQVQRTRLGNILHQFAQTTVDLSIGQVFCSTETSRTTLCTSFGNCVCVGGGGCKASGVSGIISSYKYAYNVIQFYTMGISLTMETDVELQAGGDDITCLQVHLLL